MLQHTLKLDTSAIQTYELSHAIYPSSKFPVSFRMMEMRARIGFTITNWRTPRRIKRKVSGLLTSIGVSM
jgi:hypothetical protein